MSGQFGFSPPPPYSPPPVPPAVSGGDDGLVDAADAVAAAPPASGVTSVGGHLNNNASPSRSLATDANGGATPRRHDATAGSLANPVDGAPGEGGGGDFASMSKEDLAVMVASMQSELHAMSRRQEASAQLASAQLASQLESQLGDALPMVQELVVAQVKDAMDAMVAARLDAAAARLKEDVTTAVTAAIGGSLDAKTEETCMAVITSQVVPRVGASLRKLDARIAAVEAATNTNGDDGVNARATAAAREVAPPASPLAFVAPTAAVPAVDVEAVTRKVREELRDEMNSLRAKAEAAAAKAAALESELVGRGADAANATPSGDDADAAVAPGVAEGRALTQHRVEAVSASAAVEPVLAVGTSYASAPKPDTTAASVAALVTSLAALEERVSSHEDTIVTTTASVGRLSGLVGALTPAVEAGRTHATATAAEAREAREMAAEAVARAAAAVEAADAAAQAAAKATASAASNVALAPAVTRGMADKDEAARCLTSLSLRVDGLHEELMQLQQQRREESEKGGDCDSSHHHLATLDASVEAARDAASDACSRAEAANILASTCSQRLDVLSTQVDTAAFVARAKDIDSRIDALTQDTRIKLEASAGALSALATRDALDGVREEVIEVTARVESLQLHAEELERRDRQRSEEMERMQAEVAAAASQAVAASEQNVKAASVETPVREVADMAAMNARIESMEEALREQRETLAAHQQAAAAAMSSQDETATRVEADTAEVRGRVEQLAADLMARVGALQEAVGVEIVTQMRRFEKKLTSVEHSMVKELAPRLKANEARSANAEAVATTATAEAKAALDTANAAVTRVDQDDGMINDVADRVDNAEMKLAGVSAALERLRCEMETMEASAAKEAYAANEEWAQAKGQLKQLEQAVWESVILLQDRGGLDRAERGKGTLADAVGKTPAPGSARKFQLPGSFLFRKKDTNTSNGSSAGGGRGVDGRGPIAGDEDSEASEGGSSVSDRHTDGYNGQSRTDFTVNPVLL